MWELILEKLLELLYHSFVNFIVKYKMEVKLKKDIIEKLRSIGNEEDPRIRAIRMRDFLS